MLQIAICDDDEELVAIIKKALDQNLKPIIKYHSFETTSAKQLLEYSKEVCLDLLLIDIEMPEYSGFQVVKQLLNYHHETLVIFITNIDMYVYESLKFNPFRFIRKSHISELREAILSAVEKINSAHDKFIYQINASAIGEVRVEEIVYFESQHNNVRLVTTKGEVVYRSTLRTVEVELAGKGFMRIYSSIYLNIRYIHFINVKDSEVEISYVGKNECLPISRKNMKGLVTEYKRYLR